MFAERRLDVCTKRGKGRHAGPQVMDGARKGITTFAFYSPLQIAFCALANGLSIPRKAAPGAAAAGIAKFAIIKKLPPAWRYRLGVRTEDSQSSNPGSIPGSATITAAITYTVSEHSLIPSLWPILWPPTAPSRTTVDSCARLLPESASHSSGCRCAWY